MLIFYFDGTFHYLYIHPNWKRLFAFINSSLNVPKLKNKRVRIADRTYIPFRFMIVFSDGLDCFFDIEKSQWAGWKMENYAWVLILSQPIFGKDGIDIITNIKPRTVRKQKTAIPVQQTSAQMCVRSKIWEKLVFKRYSMRTMGAYRSCLELFFAHYP